MLSGKQVPLTKEDLDLLNQVPDDYDPVVAFGKPTQEGGNLYAVRGGQPPAQAQPGNVVFGIYVPPSTPVEPDPLLNELDTLHTAVFGSSLRNVLYTPGGAPVSSLFPTPESEVLPGRSVYIPYLMVGDQVKALMLIYMFQYTTHIDIDIYSVCKDEQYTEKNTFFILLTNFRNSLPAILAESSGNYQPTNIRFALKVEQANTKRMTETGRIALYARSGFRIAGNQMIKSYEIPMKVIDHDVVDLNVVQVEYASTQFNVDIGSVHSHGTPIVMGATALAISMPQKPLTYKRGTGRFNRNNVFITGTINENREHAADYNIDKNIYFANYHAGIAYDENGLLKYMKVPDDCIIITSTAPGSVLMSNDAVVRGYMGQVFHHLVNKNPNEFFKRFPPYKYAPLHAPPLYTPQELQTRITHAIQIQGNLLSPAQIEQIYNITLQYSAFLHQFERNIAINICSLSTRTPYKQYQMEIQVNLPGNYMIEPQLQRATAGVEETAIPQYLGTFSSTERINDKDVMEGMGGISFGAYLANMIPRMPVVPGKKRVIVLTGCADVAGETGVTTPFYELSHKRTLMYNVGTLPKFPTSEDIQTLLKPYLEGNEAELIRKHRELPPCPPVQPALQPILNPPQPPALQGSGRRRRNRTHKKRHPVVRTIMYTNA